jgi:hypothetical protein
MKSVIKSGTILMYNCSGPEFSKLRQIFAMLHLRMRPVGPERYHVALEDLAVGKGEPSEESREAIPEAMLVFCGVREPLLHQVLEVIRLANLPPIPLKAMLTTTNCVWDTCQLYEELMKEREALAAAQAEAKAVKAEGEQSRPSEGVNTEAEKTVDKS